MDAMLVTGGRQFVHFRGKQRLVLLAVVAAVLVGGVSLIGARATARPHQSAAQASANSGGGTSATPDQIQKLKSWALTPGELPAGTQLRVGEEFRNYAEASGNQSVEQKLADSGRVDGYMQTWVQNSAKLQFQVFFDLYSSPAQAMAVLAYPPNTGSAQLQNLPDPKLGDASRMYGVAGTGTDGAKYQSFAVQWVRGRTVLYVSGLGPTDGLHQDDVLNEALHVDGRAKQAPIK